MCNIIDTATVLKESQDKLDEYLIKKPVFKRYLSPHEREVIMNSYKHIERIALRMANEAMVLNDLLTQLQSNPCDDKPLLSSQLLE